MPRMAHPPLLSIEVAILASLFPVMFRVTAAHGANSACKSRRRHSRLAWRIRHLSHIPDGPPDRLSCHSSTRDEWWFSIVEFVADAERPPLLVTRDPAGRPSMLHSPIALLRAPSEKPTDRSSSLCRVALLTWSAWRVLEEPSPAIIDSAEPFSRVSADCRAAVLHRRSFGGRCGAVLHALQR